MITEKQHEDRLMNIEIKISQQEHVVDALNQVVVEQQQKIDHLEKMVSSLARHIKEMSAASGDALQSNEKPPHY